MFVGVNLALMATAKYCPLMEGRGTRNADEGIHHGWRSSGTWVLLEIDRQEEVHKSNFCDTELSASFRLLVCCY